MKVKSEVETKGKEGKEKKMIETRETLHITISDGEMVTHVICKNYYQHDPLVSRDSTQLKQ